MGKPKKIAYSEPSNYFPKEVRKQFKIGEFAESTEKAKKKTTKKTVKKSK